MDAHPRIIDRIPELDVDDEDVFAAAMLASLRRQQFRDSHGCFVSGGNQYMIPYCHGERGWSSLPPRPWVNIIANEQFGCLISETGAGFTWWRNSREFRLTPWSNDAVLDPPGEAFYLRDEESGYGLYINVHMTTSSIARTCARHHTVVLAVVHLASGEIVAELGYKGDFGSVKTTERMNDQNLIIQPTFRSGCPDQQAIADETNFV